jgi:hypothetical protein
MSLASKLGRTRQCSFGGIYVGWIRSFSADSDGCSDTRNVEDAPRPMRQELVDLFFSLAEHSPDEVPPEHIYRATAQSLGIEASGVPYSGFRYATGRDINKVEWPRVYDLIARLWPDFDRHALGRGYREGVNRILAAHSSAWELDESGRLSRVLPVEAVLQIAAAFRELQVEHYSPALQLFKAAKDAYDDRPRRDRDACSNMFDAMESVAKEKYKMPNSTFGQVVAHISRAGTMNPQVVGVLSAVNDLRNRNFGHGMTTLFRLSPAEVDFTYLACVGGILLLARLP